MIVPFYNMVKIGTVFKKSATKAMLLGCGELGKEVAIELKRLGVEVIGVDKYKDAPAMQIADRSYVISMLDAEALEHVIRKENPNLIIPEVEAIATQKLLELEAQGFRVIPTAKAVNFTMNRENIRKLAAEELGMKTSPYMFASNKEVRRMVELTLLNIIYILFFSRVITTIIAFALIIALAIIISKSE